MPKTEKYTQIGKGIISNVSKGGIRSLGYHLGFAVVWGVREATSGHCGTLGERPLLPVWQPPVNPSVCNRSHGRYSAFFPSPSDVAETEGACLPFGAAPIDGAPLGGTPVSGTPLGEGEPFVP